MKNHATLAQQEFVAKQLRRRRMVTGARISLLVLLLALWEISVRAGLLNGFIFSSPSRILHCLSSMVLDGSIFLHTGITILETVISFALVTAIGIFGAVALWSSKSLSEILDPYLVMLNSLPKSALAPILIVWLGSNMRTIVVAAVSVAVFGSILTLHNGFKTMDPDQIKLIYSLGGGKRDILFKVLLPGSVPLIISNMKVNIGLCLVGVIIGEFLAARAGLGYLIIYSSQVFRWGGILILCDIVQFIYSINLLILQILSAVQHILPIPHFSKYPVSPQTVLPLSSQKNIRQT